MNDSQTELSQRIDALEAKLTYQELTIQQLSLEIVEQQKVIVKLENQAKTLAGRLRELFPSNDQPPPDQRPPHY